MLSPNSKLIAVSGTVIVWMLDLFSSNGGYIGSRLCVMSVGVAWFLAGLAFPSSTRVI